MIRRVAALIAIAGLAVSVPAQAAGARSDRESSAERAGMSSTALARLDAAIEAAIRNHATPGAALAIGRHGQIIRMRGYGNLTYAADAPAVTDSTLFDLASLTKIVGTTTAVMKLVDEGRLDLDTPIYQYLRTWPSMGPSRGVTLRHLLTHTSGLPAGADLWTVSGREARISRIAQMRLVSPPGTQTIYSDLGMIVVGAVVESVTGERLDDYLEREVFAPLRMPDTQFNPDVESAGLNLSVAAPIVVEPHERSTFFPQYMLLAEWSEAADAPLPMFAAAGPPAHLQLPRERVAPTEYDPDLGYALQGTVHDQTAAALGGVAGNAGLFSTVRDLAGFAQMMLDAVAHDVDTPIMRAATVRDFLATSPGAERALGWEVPTGRSSAGDYFSRRSVGHTGYTGTSIWIDPDRDVFVVLLTNRVYPSATNQKHIALRRTVHDDVELAIQDEMVLSRADIEKALRASESLTIVR